MNSSRRLNLFGHAHRAASDICVCVCVCVYIYIWAAKGLLLVPALASLRDRAQRHGDARRAPPAFARSAARSAWGTARPPGPWSGRPPLNRRDGGCAPRRALDRDPGYLRFANRAPLASDGRGPVVLIVRHPRAPVLSFAVPFFSRGIRRDKNRPWLPIPDPKPEPKSPEFPAVPRKKIIRARAIKNRRFLRPKRENRFKRRPIAARA